ncbi:hypothetical protein ACFWVM_00890 [Nocardia fluminea]|uniref:hypothetical protein n=1 Tax=Nocardia fluminea TaxID=134984 RepID=UPI0036505244
MATPGRVVPRPPFLLSPLWEYDSAVAEADPALVVAERPIFCDAPVTSEKRQVMFGYAVHGLWCARHALC